MKKFKAIGISILVAACAACLSLAFVACKGGEKSASYGAGEEGFYYYDGANSARYMLSLQSGTYMITANNETQYSGSYSYNEETGEISFSGDAAFTATVGENALSLDMGDSGYSFKAYKYFDVTYVDENGNTVATESVLNGQSAEAITVEKDGYYFIGWYEDSSNSTEFAFNTSIAGDTTVYGWYIEKNPQATEYEITLDYGDGTVEYVSTMNGAVWTLPSDGILGWWVSATNKSGELTYKYETGTAFTSDTTLFAVYSGMGASVTSEGITWENAAGSDVYVSIYDEKGETILDRSRVSSSTTIYAPATFTSLGAGTYTIEVESGSTTETLTYIVNGLPRVSLSSADVVVNGNGRVISFAPVEGASGYEITITDGTKTVTENLGSRTYYNFSGWDMTEEGLTFTVTAYADGYVSSVSDEYNYLLKLDKVTLEMSGDDVVWSRVEGALEYEVVIYKEAGVTVLESFYTEDTSYSLKYYDAGTYTISVKPVTDGYWSTESFIYGQAKSTIAAPVITDITSYTITWSGVKDAESYVVMINGEPYEVTEGTTLNFSEENVPDANSYEIAVMAVAEVGLDSSYSDTVTATNGGFKSSVRYEKNTIYWDYDVSATSYDISVNGATTTVSEGNSKEITLTKAGNNEITVTAYSETDVLGQATIDVYAYAMTLDTNGATFENSTAASNTIYVAQGDTLNLGEVVKDHANFIGWYTQADYTDGQSDVYEGKGSEVVGGSVFMGSRDMYLYAYWSYEYLTVNLYTDSNTLYDTVQVKYNTTSFTFPIVESTSQENSFVGWYEYADGVGTQFTSYNGVYSGSGYGETYSLYAYFLPILSYNKTTYNGETVYAVSANTKVDVSLFPEIKIPESYVVDGTPYSLILNSGAFNNCTKLEKLEIPDTILYIATTNDGSRSGAGAFAGCTALREVNVYATEDVVEPMYFSSDGVLFHKMSGDSGDVEIIYYPYAKSLAAYSIPATVFDEYETDSVTDEIVYHNVTSVPSQVFRYRKITQITFPNTVTFVDSQAFYDNTELASIVFAPGGTGELTLSVNAFRGCTSVTEVTLPARYSEFDADAFSECSSLINVYVEDGGTYISDSGVLLDATGTTLVYFPIGRSGAVVTSEMTTTGLVAKIGENAFASNAKITSVTISENVTEIGTSAFEGCIGIEVLTFLGTDISLDLKICSRAFYGCVLLTEVSLPSRLTIMEANAFGGCSNLYYVYFDSRSGAKIEDLSFAAASFGSTNSIITLELGPNVPAIYVGEIFDGGKLQEVIIDPLNQNFYSDDGVVYDVAMTEIIYYPRGKEGAYELLPTTETVAANIFTDRVNLTYIKIGAAVTSIADQEFSGCTYLTGIEVDSQNERYASSQGILYEKENGVATKLLYCPIMNSVAEISVPQTVTSVAKNAFENNVTVISVTFATDATTEFTLSESAFSNATALETVVMPGKMTEIPANAFYCCGNLTYVTLSDSLTEIGDNAFYRCYSLVGDLNDSQNGMKLPEGLTTIGEKAFYLYESLPTSSPEETPVVLLGAFAVTIPSTVTSIGQYAFYGCWNDEENTPEIVFAKSESGTEENLEIGAYAFEYTRYASKVEIPARCTSIGNYGFGYFGSYLDEDVTAEITFETGCKLAELNNYVFYYAGNVESITIPASVKSIGTTSFGYISSLKSIAFSPAGETSSLTTIGATAFNGTGLTGELTIPKTVTSIGNSAFQSTKLTALLFEEGSQLNSIGNQAFGYMSNLKEIAIPASVTSIDHDAFSNCTSLEKVTFAGEGETSGITSFGYWCFKGCTALKEVILPSNLKNTNNGTQTAQKKEGAFEGCTALEKISIPASLTTLNGYTFNGCTSLSEVTFETNGNGTCALSEVGDMAFYGCTSLTSFAFPESTVTITLGSQIFEGSGVTTIHLSSSVTSLGSGLVGSAVSKITVAESHPVFVVDDTNMILYNQTKDTVEYMYSVLTGEIDLSSFTGITTIGPGAFSCQTAVTAITIPASVTRIDQYAFYGCTALTTVTFAEGSQLTSLGSYAFYECTSLKKINLPEGLTSIPTYCFRYCDMSEATYPDSLTTLNTYCLANTKMTMIELKSVTTMSDCCLAETEELTTVKLGATSVTISGEVFEYCYKLTTLECAGTFKMDGNYIFRQCTSLEYINIPSGTTATGANAFDGCTSLIEVVLPETLTTLGNYAFQNCSSLEKCDLPSSLTTINTTAFGNCVSLKSVVLPDSVTSVANYAFKGCLGLETIEFNTALTSITGSEVFSGCESLTSVTIGRNIASVGAKTFYGCTSLEYVYTGDKLTALSDNMFYGCVSLETVEFGPLVRTIGTSTFQGCTSLKSLALSRIDTIGASAFADCTGLESVMISSYTSSVGSGAFASCTCDIYLENSANYTATYWSGWDDGFEGTAYYYSQSEPAVNEDNTAYVGNYWYYDEDRNAVPWVFGDKA